MIAIFNSERLTKETSRKVSQGLPGQTSLCWDAFPCIIQTFKGYGFWHSLRFLRTLWVLSQTFKGQWHLPTGSSFVNDCSSCKYCLCQWLLHKRCIQRFLHLVVGEPRLFFRHWPIFRVSVCLVNDLAGEFVEHRNGTEPSLATCKLRDLVHSEAMRHPRYSLLVLGDCSDVCAHTACQVPVPPIAIGEVILLTPEGCCKPQLSCYWQGQQNALRVFRCGHTGEHFSP